MLEMDLNADLGEGGSMDSRLIAHATSVNIACGGHAGDTGIMRRCVEEALAAGVAVGAHPGYEDPVHFGRRPLHLEPEEVRVLLCRQLNRMLAIHDELHHVKPHGALYHQANADPDLAAAVASSIHELQPATLLVCPPDGHLRKAAEAIHLRTCAEGFIDRRYLADGKLSPRSGHRAVIEDLDEAVGQALKITLQGAVGTVEGNTIPLRVRTLCVHGDSPDAVEILKLTRHYLEESGVRVCAAS